MDLAANTIDLLSQIEPLKGDYVIENYRQYQATVQEIRDGLQEQLQFLTKHIPSENVSYKNRRELELTHLKTTIIHEELQDTLALLKHSI